MEEDLIYSSTLTTIIKHNLNIIDSCGLLKWVYDKSKLTSKKINSEIRHDHYTKQG